jgi:monoamine oxidase
MTSQVDIVVIGAGAAGLSAAWHLKKAGLTIRVIEARDRVGGRVHSVPSPGYPIELGAEFVHGTSEDIWSIIRDSQATAYEVTDDHLVLRGHHFRNAPDFWDEIGQTIQKIEKHQRSLTKDSNLRDLLKHASDISEERKTDLLGFVEGFHAADPALISTQALIHEETEADENEGASSFRLINGYDHLLKYLANQLGDAVMLRQLVRRIEWSRGKVRVHANEIFEARGVLVTLPVNILKTSTALFSPPLETKKVALEKIEMGAVIKIVFQFKTDFFRRGKFKDLAFLHSDDKNFPTWWSSRPLKLPYLTGWSGGKKAQHLSSLEDDQIAEQAIDSMSRIFGIAHGEIKAQIKSWHIHNWQRDPLSKGAYSFIKEGGFGAQKELAKPVDSTIFFAGEATQFDEGQIGTVDGALASGRRAAREMIGLLR